MFGAWTSLEPYLRAAVREKNTSYYLYWFRRFYCSSALRPSWNWATFVFGMGWFFYRKMPGIILIYIISFSISYSILVKYTDIFVGLGYYLIIAKIVIPAYATNIYYKRIMISVKYQIKQNKMRPGEIRNALKDKFGTITQISSNNPDMLRKL